MHLERKLRRQLGSHRKQTIIDKDNFTFTQAGTLPFMYKVNNRPYVLKGWYKGKENQTN